MQINLCKNLVSATLISHDRNLNLILVYLNVFSFKQNYLCAETLGANPHAYAHIFKVLSVLFVYWMYKIFSPKNMIICILELDSLLRFSSVTSTSKFHSAWPFMASW